MMTSEEKAAAQAIQAMMQKAVHFDETIAVINHWLMHAHKLNIIEQVGYWQSYSTDDNRVDIRRETYSQCLAALLDHISGREVGS